MVGELLTEAATAELLAVLLADEELWVSGYRPPASVEARVSLARQALRLYQATGPNMDERVVLTPGAFDMAIHQLREIADRCAMLSEDWPRWRLRRLVNVPTKEYIKRALADFHIAEWAADQGQELDLTPGDEAFPPFYRSLWRTKVSQQTIAEQFRLLDQGYSTLLELRASGKARLSPNPKAEHHAAGRSSRLAAIFGSCRRHFRKTRLGSSSPTPYS